MKFFKEKDTGDFGCYDPWAVVRVARFTAESDLELYEGRATAISGQVSSVQTTGISRGYLKEKTIPVDQKDIPPEWLKMLI